jgi:hypothetical protein
VRVAARKRGWDQDCMGNGSVGIRMSKGVYIEWSKIGAEREPAALNGSGDQEWVGAGTEPALRSSCSSSVATGTNSSAGARSVVLTHCFTAP